MKFSIEYNEKFNTNLNKYLNNTNKENKLYFLRQSKLLKFNFLNNFNNYK